MAEPRTRPTGASVTALMAAIEDRQVRADAEIVTAMMRRATGKRATMWGPRIVGYGRYHYRYASGQAGEFMRKHYDTR